MTSSPPSPGGFRRASPADVERLAALCARASADPPDADELRLALGDDEQPAWVAGDCRTGAVVVTRGGDTGYVRLLAVDPPARRHGLGSALLAAAERELAGCAAIEAGGDVPFYLHPGVPVDDLAAMCLFEKHRFQRAGLRLNLAVDPRSVPATDTSAVRPAQSADGPAVRRFCVAHWPDYGAEAARALARGTLLIRTNATGELTGLCAHSVSRKGWLGPVAVRPDLVGHGHGTALVTAAVEQLAAGGHTGDVVVEWVGPLRPYARLGARVHRAYAAYRKELAAAPAPSDP
jgi:GNAT superfamily N-acetyltransferase